MAKRRLLNRVQAAQAVVDDYLNKPLVWGKRDCGRMAGAVLRGMGHSPKLSRFGSYKTLAGALKAIRTQKFNDLPDVLDAMGFDRIPLAMVLPSDIVAVPGEGMTALGVALGNGRVLAFAEDCICRVGQLSNIDVAIAWRVPCRKS